MNVLLVQITVMAMLHVQTAQVHLIVPVIVVIVEVGLAVVI